MALSTFAWESLEIYENAFITHGASSGTSLVIAPALKSSNLDKAVTFNISFRFYNAISESAKWI